MSAQPSVHSHKWDDVGDTVLYDVMAEAATALSGRLVWLEDHAEDATRAQAWRDRRLQLQRDRRGVQATDRPGMMAAIERWTAERTELAGYMSAK